MTVQVGPHLRSSLVLGTPRRLDNAVSFFATERACPHGIGSRSGGPTSMCSCPTMRELEAEHLPESPRRMAPRRLVRLLAWQPSCYLRHTDHFRRRGRCQPEDIPNMPLGPPAVMTESIGTPLARPSFDRRGLWRLVGARECGASVARHAYHLS